jgi:hypothetical protein
MKNNQTPGSVARRAAASSMAALASEEAGRRVAPPSDLPPFDGKAGPFGFCTSPGAARAPPSLAPPPPPTPPNRLEP